jgi:hypothetical protein
MYSSFNTVRMIIYIYSTHGEINTYKIWVGKSTGKDHLADITLKWILGKNRS